MVGGDQLIGIDQSQHGHLESGGAAHSGASRTSAVARRSTSCQQSIAPAPGKAFQHPVIALRSARLTAEETTSTASSKSYSEGATKIRTVARVFSVTS